MAVLPLIGALVCACFLVAGRGTTSHPAAASAPAASTVAPRIAVVDSAIIHTARYPAPHGHGYFCSSTLATPYPCGDASEPFVNDASVFRWYHGHGTGPSPRTAYGKDTIIGSHDCGVRHCATTSVSYVPPALRQSGVQPNGCGATWYEPWTYCWSDIFGAIWNYFLSPCLTGAMDGFIGTASGQVIINALNRGGQVFMDQWGYVAIAFGNCIVNLMHKATG